MEELLKDIGKRISDLRKRSGYTQEQLAELMDVSIQMISNLERGNKAIRIDNLLKISKIFGVSTDYILSGKQSESELSDKLNKLSERDYSLICQMVDFCIENNE